MFHKIHLKLTALCTGTTMLILLIMSLCYLYVSETGLRKNQFNAFKNDCNTITANLEQQSVITMEWLSKMEAQGNYSLFLLDNGVPFLFNQLTALTSSKEEQLLQESLSAYREQYSLTQNRSASPFYAFHVEFPFYSQTALQNYFCGIIEINRNSSQLQLIILSSQARLEHQIFKQRLIFLLINLSAFFLLALFFFWFTGRLLRPVMENQQKQVQFIASASHELRTPLAIILSSAECIDFPDQQAEGEKDVIERAHHFSGIIREEGARMSSLINRLLELSVLDVHRASLEMSDVELDTLLMNSYESFEPLAYQKNITLSVSLPENPVPCCYCSREHIAQVLSVLLHNAISYTPKQGTIQLSLAFRKSRFYLSVADNGIGIPDEEKKKIFDRFYRAETSRSTKDHFGLGLSIAAEIIKAHRGTLAVTDTPGGGATFTVTLPNA